MSLYLDMWIEVKKLNLEEVNTWIRTLEPAKGYTINFYGLKPIDVDLLEALRNYQPDLIHDIELKKQRNNHEEQVQLQECQASSLPFRAHCNSCNCGSSGG